MKVGHKKEKEKFKPVVITLESQEEVDCLYILLNNSNNEVRRLVGITEQVAVKVPVVIDFAWDLFRYVSEYIRGE